MGSSHFTVTNMKKLFAIAFLLTVMDLARGAIYGAPTASPTSVSSDPYVTNSGSGTPYSGISGGNTAARAQPVCFPERCQACQESFGLEPIVSYDCQGKCGLCQLCEGRPRFQIPQCERWCTMG